MVTRNQFAVRLVRKPAGSVASLDRAHVPDRGAKTRWGRVPVRVHRTRWGRGPAQGAAPTAVGRLPTARPVARASDGVPTCLRVSFDREPGAHPHGDPATGNGRIGPHGVPDPGGTRRSPRWVDGGCNEGGLTATPRKINPETLNRCGPSQTTGGSMPEHWGGPKQNNQQRKHETHSTCHCAGHHRGGAQFHGSGPTSAGRWSSWWRASRRSGRSWG